MKQAKGSPHETEKVAKQQTQGGNSENNIKEIEICGD